MNNGSSSAGKVYKDSISSTHSLQYSKIPYHSSFNPMSPPSNSLLTSSSSSLTIYPSRGNTSFTSSSSSLSSHSYSSSSSLNSVSPPNAYSYPGMLTPESSTCSEVVVGGQQQGVLSNPLSSAVAPFYPRRSMYPQGSMQPGSSSTAPSFQPGWQLGQWPSSTPAHQTVLSSTGGQK